MILRKALRPAVRGHICVWALAAAVLTLLTTATAVTVSAHPLGNTSVNLYERVEIGPQEIGVRFILDISEIPALREKEFADTDDDGSVDEAEATTYLNGFWEYLEPNLTLTIDGQPQPLQRLDPVLDISGWSGRSSTNACCVRPDRNPDGRTGRPRYPRRPYRNRVRGRSGMA